ncbi:type I-E CRISPR-associated protein Cas6/Cse3/CasE [Rhodovulum sulfidophilum]|uniref:Type I-E CRISPR-associated protein Cas6/Cse3/CasE n=2 Tax=Rhodovulum visakhapatnamense TaxID=364297 RepID=A0ABS1RB09_9RHOB|nr:type I-E CRISPR-associated protein Cas6/Cse3/CasE [Rhodovulum visakhapatnamense]MBL3576827.1 type I-E CRISPR-associated protein Cas6/Cse3/CasE [Rhodovulum visakhapatnamense]OLS43928.1 type I-E CRISPR-associated protein Cas6/Cse3/CasE [Rhodovulum sulfidophilum]
MSLHLVELPMQLRSLHLWAGQRGLSDVSDEGMALHHVLGEAFGPAMLQPFRMMVAPRSRVGTLYAYSRRNADELRDTGKGSLTPGLAEVVQLDRLRSLPRAAESWTAGQRLGFDLRTRPVIRLASARDGRTESGAKVRFRKGAEIDAFLAAALLDDGSTREAVYLNWLAERLAPTAELDHETSRLASFRRSIVQRNGRRIEGPDATLHGTLTITDPDAFTRLLARGVGRHRAYGFGMLLLRPPQRRRIC